jgi:hypothetical protein
MAQLRSIFVFLFLFVITVAHGEETCNSEEGECNVEERRDQPVQSLAPKCARSHCTSAGGIYRYGTAQAYKAEAPISSEICQDTESNLNVASWPYYRSSYKQAPRIGLKMNLWSCQDCCCQPLADTATVEVWQARPNGSYSSLTMGVEEGICRARQMVTNEAHFETYAPGSTGSLGGLGPSHWDSMPYGKPVIHVLVTANAYDPVLIDLPVFFNARDLEERRWHWPDWRGAAWVKEKTIEPPYNLTSWKTGEDRIDLELDIFLTPNDKAAASSLQNILCSSYMHGLPPGFFLEPISMCTPLLDFFAL